MKTIALIPVYFLAIWTLVFGQTNFDVQAYHQFLANNQNLTFQDLRQRYPLPETYYKFSPQALNLNRYQYFDSVQIKFNLTLDEINLLKQNHFVVSERLSYPNFGKAFHDIYNRDLPVFVTTDAILHALHVAYDNILLNIELSLLKPHLQAIVNGLYSSFPLLLQRYEAEPALQNALSDVDIYVTIAKSLLDNQKEPAQLVSQGKIDTIWQCIQDEQVVSLALFSDRERSIDFSQFTVRGHYTIDGLPEYFKTMMWLGRIGFFLTPPPPNPYELPWSKEDIKRMNLAAFMLDELLDLAGVRDLLEQNDRIINFFVGESDNLTPAEYQSIKTELGLTSAKELLNDQTYEQYQTTLANSEQAQQKILSQILMTNPFSSEPDSLPIIFLLSGQRFIIDSYILFNVVYDRIVYQGNKIWRPLPDPLDAMFALGNNDALYLLKDALQQYHYASQLNALRYLIDAYDDDFWNASLYNVWLNAIRSLNPTSKSIDLADFTTSAAWHQCKLNTQLASWAQLRHDNLLYAKQSYTGGTGCSYPYSFIEPNPEFFEHLKQFAHKANEFFAPFPDDSLHLKSSVQQYFATLDSTMTRLEALAQKEIDQQPFSANERAWLKTMLFEDGQSGHPPYDGWYARLFYNPWDAIKDDYVIADVHTQPTDQMGNAVGHVLHVGTGKINLAVFLAQAPYEGFPPMAFVGPVLSYYEKVTSNFKRLTDEAWKQSVENNALPERPDWVNIYLTDVNGQQKTAGRELPAKLSTGLFSESSTIVTDFELFQNFPNPFNPVTTIQYKLGKPGLVTLTVYNLTGEKIATLLHERQSGGLHKVKFDGRALSSGTYLVRLKAGNFVKTIKMTFIK